MVATLHALTGDLGEAQDLTQESFCRAWQRWHSIAAYDNPVAWVRRVAVNLANSRWRHLRVADRHLRRERCAVLPPMQPDHVAPSRRCATCRPGTAPPSYCTTWSTSRSPRSPRSWGFRSGTVKAWLSRGRAALALHLGDLPAGVPDKAKEGGARP